MLLVALWFFRAFDGLLREVQGGLWVSVRTFGGTFYPKAYGELGLAMEIYVDQVPGRPTDGPWETYSWLF